MVCGKQSTPNNRRAGAARCAPARCKCSASLVPAKGKSAKSGPSAAFFHARRLSRNVKIGNPDLPFCETMLTFVITAGGSPTPGLASFFSVPASGKTNPGLAFTSPGLVKTSPGLVKTSPSVENSTPSVENFTPGFVIPARRVVTPSPGGVVRIGTKTVTEG